MDLATHKRSALPAIAGLGAPVRQVPAEPAPVRRLAAAQKKAATLRLLLIEDSEEDAAAVVRGLIDAGYGVSPERVHSFDELARALKRQQWDLAVSKLALPGLKGMSALKLVRRYDAHLPFVFMSDGIGVETAIEAIKGGAQDCIGRKDMARLA